MSSHAPLAPSAAYRWMRCPGSIAAIGDRESPDNVYSREGTFLHAVAARILKEDIDVAGSLIGFTNGEFTLDRDGADAVQVYVDAVREVAMLGGKMRVEEKVTVTSKVYGTPDATIWGTGEKTRLDVFDFKAGRGVYVDAADNEQEQIYALGEIADAGLDPRQVDEIGLHIVQPRYFGAEAHRHVVISGQDLQAFRVRMLAAAAATEQPGAPLIAGEHCRFCPVAAMCPALQKQSMAIAQQLFPDGNPAAPVRPPDVHALQTLPADQLAAVLDNLPAVESWIEVIREHAKARAIGGEALPGWKLIERTGNRKWISEDQAVAAMRHYGVDPFEAPAVISPAQAEKRSKHLKSIVSKLTQRNVTGVMLVHATDPRAALDPAAAFPILEGPTK